MQRGHLERGDRHFDIVKLSNDRLELGIIHTVKRFNDYQVVFLLLVFSDRGLYRREMLLIRNINVVQQRANTGQEGTADLEGFRMPIL